MKHLTGLGLLVVSLSAWFAVADSSSSNAAKKNRCRDEVRGDGTVAVGEGRQRAKFHVRGMEDENGSSGQLDFRDKSNGVRLRSNNLIDYDVVDGETRQLTFDLGSDDTNVLNTAVVILRDLGKRGKNDFFEITVADYLASGNLRAGQVRLKANTCEPPGSPEPVPDPLPEPPLPEPEPR